MTRHRSWAASSKSSPSRSRRPAKKRKRTSKKGKRRSRSRTPSRDYKRAAKAKSRPKARPAKTRRKAKRDRMSHETESISLLRRARERLSGMPAMPESPLSKSRLVENSPRTRAPAAFKRKVSPTVEPKRACPFCDEDHGGDGHPFERDEEPSPLVVKRARTPFQMRPAMAYRGNVIDGFDEDEDEES